MQDVVLDEAGAVDAEQFGAAGGDDPQLDVEMQPEVGPVGLGVRRPQLDELEMLAGLLAQDGMLQRPVGA